MLKSLIFCCLLDDFKKSQGIGMGSFGRVYQVVYVQEPKVKFALKETPATLEADGQLTEIDRMWERYQHPHLIKVVAQFHYQDFGFRVTLAS